MHVILYDSQCPLCIKSVQFLLKIDEAELLSFSPLTGKTAEIFFRRHKKDLSSLIFVESFGEKEERVWKRGKGVLRILFLLGGWWRVLGAFYWVPGLGAIYRLVARHRHSLGKEMSSTLLIPKERSLP